jgi:hypothetical protein
MHSQDVHTTHERRWIFSSRTTRMSQRDEEEEAFGLDMEAPVHKCARCDFAQSWLWLTEDHIAYIVAGVSTLCRQRGRPVPGWFHSALTQARIASLPLHDPEGSLTCAALSPTLDRRRGSTAGPCFARWSAMRPLPRGHPWRIRSRPGPGPSQAWRYG